MVIKALASKLALHHDTRDPFRIAADLGFIIIDTPLNGIRGFYQYIRRCHIIYLDSNLSEAERTWVCAHELGHYFLHRGFNRIFMDKHTLVVTSRYEHDADHFAADLIYSDDFLRDFIEIPYTTIASDFNIPPETAKYRMSTVKHS